MQHFHRTTECGAKLLVREQLAIIRVAADVLLERVRCESGLRSQGLVASGEVACDLRHQISTRGAPQRARLFHHLGHSGGDGLDAGGVEPAVYSVSFATERMPPDTTSPRLIARPSAQKSIYLKY